MRVLVTGASGYIGGRLVAELLDAGHSVRACSRNPDGLARFGWYHRVETSRVDLDDPSTLPAAVEGMDVIYYLVHSMGSGDSRFEDSERSAAEHLTEAAAAAGVRRIVYLSGLHPPVEDLSTLSQHMRSRERVARILLEGEVPAVVFRAATIIGSGSASFEIIRHLTERLPVMTAPQWINNHIEPLSVRDVLYYLTAAAAVPALEGVNDAFDIGCGSVYRFSDLLRNYGRLRGLRRLIIALPIPLPMDQLSGGWISFVTPVPRSLAVPLAQSMAENAVTTDGHRVAGFIPDPPGGLADYETAVRRALQREEDGNVPTSWDTSWQDRVSHRQVSDELPTDPDWAGQTVYSDSRVAYTDAPVEDVWRIIESVGGHNGWYSTPSLWNIRGIMDRLVGGPGLGGRRDPLRLAAGDRVDWWRVERIERPNVLVLRAEMKVSGRAWLVMRVDTAETGGSAGMTRYRQDAVFLPRGLKGRAYWWMVAPFHRAIFPLMKRNILSAASDTPGRGPDRGSIHTDGR